MACRGAGIVRRGHKAHQLIFRHEVSDLLDDRFNQVRSPERDNRPCEPIGVGQPANGPGGTTCQPGKCCLTVELRAEVGEARTGHGVVWTRCASQPLLDGAPGRLLITMHQQPHGVVVTGVREGGGVVHADHGRP